MSTQIQWTHRPGTIGETWNPTTGCTQKSPGCANCYAKALHDKRHKALLAGKKMLPMYAEPFEHVQCHEDRLDTPLHWKRPRTVFVNSMSDLFDKQIPDEFIDKVFEVMSKCPQHTFIILTKDAARMKAYFDQIIAEFAKLAGPGWVMQPLKNVWLVVSVENQRFADERIPLLLQTPAAVRGISAEPLLGPLNLSGYLRFDVEVPGAGFRWKRGIEWVIAGGESGPKHGPKAARPFDIEWARDLRRQCIATHRPVPVPFFLKQLGTNPFVDRNDEVGGGIRCGLPLKLRDKKGGNPEEWPKDLRDCRAFPEVRA